MADQTSKRSLLSSTSSASHPSITNTLASSTGSASTFEQPSIEVQALREVRASNSWFRSRVFDISESSAFSNVILCAILINTVLMYLETINDFQRKYAYYLAVVDQCLLGIYILEAGIKIFAWRTKYFKSAWNLFDFLIVIVSIFTWLAPYFLTSGLDFNVRIFRLFRVFRAIRALRSVRVLRTIKFLRSLQMIISTVLKSITAMSNIALLTFILMYFFSVLGTTLFRWTDPVRFESIFSTMFRMVQLMAQDSWSDIYTDQQTSNMGLNWYLNVAVFIMSFILINLLIAVLINNLQSARQRSRYRRKLKKRMEEEAGMLDLDNDNTDKLEELDEEHDAKKLTEEEKMLEDLLFEEKYGISNYYPPNLPEREKQLLSQYYSQLSSLELNQLTYQRHQKVLDDMVDLCLTQKDVSILS
ncbi:hypothetical protein HDV05_008188 [Chytridiales sp. JEL 0842]|nr:hypothetical protein HDV05_008188 [Chytridiales sp. JEL 0842]